MKTLIAYYSRRGENYVDGKIANLAVGNTEVAAAMIQKLTGGAAFRIDTVKTYPDDYGETTETAKEELRRNARPELASRLTDTSAYDVVVLGYPNWWGTMPMAVFTFLEEHDWKGKTILPFCTHEGSGLGRSVADIQKACAGATVSAGLAIRGGRVHGAEAEIAAWLKANGLLR